MNRQSQRGQIVPLVALALIVLIGAAGLAVDVGYHQYKQRLQQSATDSAAIAATAEHIAGTDIQKAALLNAASNGFTDTRTGTDCATEETICVEATSPPSTGSYTTNNNAVQVTIASEQPTFFERMIPGLSSKVKITTRAVGLAAAGSTNPCLITTNPAQNTNFNDDTVKAPNCTFNIDGTGSFHGADMSVGAVDCVSASACSNLSSPPPTVTLPASDPCMSIPGCVTLTNSPPNASGCGSYSVPDGGSATASCYNNLTLNGSVTLSQGLYVVTGQLNANKATVTGTGVTIYLAQNATMNFNQAQLTLSACTSTPSCLNGAEPNVLFYQVPSNTNDINFNLAQSTNFSGLLYFPNSQVNVNQDFGTGYTLMVFGYANFNKGNYNFSGLSGPGGPIVLVPVLAE
jgi:hypothetical protein